MRQSQSYGAISAFTQAMRSLGVLCAVVHVKHTIIVILVVIEVRSEGVVLQVRSDEAYKRSRRQTHVNPDVG